MNTNTTPPTGPAERVWAGRVLDLTRATATYRHLEDTITELGEALRGDIFGPERDDAASLTEALTEMHTDTTAAWMDGKPMWWGFYEDKRVLAIAHAERLQALAEDIEDAARAIAHTLARATPLDTPERLADLITEAGSCLEDGQDTPDLADLWQRLGPSDLFGAEAEARLRRQFDRDLDTTVDPALAEAVNTWRGNYMTGRLGPVTWDADMFEYAIATVRAWPDLVGIWETITTAAHARLITGAEAVRLRDTIAARVRAGGTTPAMPEQLREALADYDTNGTALGSRIRLAEDVATLENVWEALAAGDDLEHMGLRCALLRKARTMQLDQFEDTTDRYTQSDINRADALLSKLDTWHRGLFVLADRIATGGADGYTADEAYSILYYALDAVEDLNNDARRDQLIGMVDRARDRGRITEDHHARITAALPARS